MIVRVFGGTDMQLGRSDMVRVRVNSKLGLTDYSNPVGPIWVISETESWPSKLDGTDVMFR